MRIDLHTHSTVSDGTQTPAELVTAAAAAGLDVLGVTDHDTTAGWDDAAAAARSVGIDLVRGMEVSTRHRGQGVHLLAYLFDPTHPALLAELARVLGGRDSRLPAMVAALRAAGVDISVDDVGGTVRGRPHVADALVRLGVAPDRTQAFEEWLVPGRPGYIDRYAAPLTTMIALVAEAGGVTVVAHPWGRGRRAALPPDEIARLAGLGLGGLEVDHRDHEGPTDVREELRGIARELDLVATGSSDHHGLGKIDHELGCHTTDPAHYERLLERAAAAAAASGRVTPEVVRAD